MANNIWSIQPPAVEKIEPPDKGNPPAEELVPISAAVPRLRFTGLGVRVLDINPQLKAHMEYDPMIYNWVMTAVSIAAHSSIPDPEATMRDDKGSVSSYPVQERIETPFPIPENFKEALGAGKDSVIVVHRHSPGHFKVMT